MKDDTFASIGLFVLACAFIFAVLSGTRECGIPIGHHMGVCDQACHGRSRVIDDSPLKCLCPNDRVVTFKAKP